LEMVSADVSTQIKPRFFEKHKLVVGGCE